MNEALAILFVGDVREGTTCRQRFQALVRLGHKVTPINTVPSKKSNRALEIWSRVSSKLFRMGFPEYNTVDGAGVNQAILDHVRSSEPDLLWLDKGLTIRRRTLTEVKRIGPRCIIVGYSPDDMAARHNQSGAFLDSLPLHDIYFTTKSYGVPELQSLGCRRVEFVGNAFDPETHRPRDLAPHWKQDLGGPVGFIGTYERERARSMEFLASNGVAVRIYGNGWESVPAVKGSLRVEHRPVLGVDYAEVLCAFDINLCFLRRLNRDLQTQRSVEIPACGAFMLGERTEEHLDLFKEGVEAEYFSSDDELLDKVRYYLAHPEQRLRIAAAGRERCLKDGYSYPDRLRSMLETVRSELILSTQSELRS